MIMGQEQNLDDGSLINVAKFESCRNNYNYRMQFIAWPLPVSPTFGEICRGMVFVSEKYSTRFSTVVQQGILRTVHS